MRSQDRSIKERALTRMLRSHVIENRALMEKLGTPEAMLRAAKRESTPDWIEDLAHRLQEALPPGVTAERESADGGGEALILRFDGYEDEHGGAMALIAPFKDRSGADWAVAVGAYLTPASAEDEEEPEDDAESGDDSRTTLLGLANRLNDHVAAGTWLLHDGTLALVTGAARRAGAWSDTDVSIAAESIMDAVAYGSFALRAILQEDNEHPAYTRAQQAEEYHVASGSAYTPQDMREALDGYLETLPELLAAVTELRHRPDMAQVGNSLSTLHLPFPGEDGEEYILVRVWVEHNLDATASPDGIKLQAVLPVALPRDQAASWCALLNGGDDSDEVAVTTGWQYGNWYHRGPEEDEGEGARHGVAYFATIPNKYRGRIDLVAEIAGAMKEIWSSCDRVMFSRRYAGLMEGGGQAGREG